MARYLELALAALLEETDTRAATCGESAESGESQNVSTPDVGMCVACGRDPMWWDTLRGGAYCDACNPRRSVRRLRDEERCWSCSAIVFAFTHDGEARCRRHHEFFPRH